MAKKRTAKQKAVQNKMKRIAAQWRKKTESYRKTHSYRAFVKRAFK